MTVFEALIIYLSAGAPFGVLVFFSKRTAIRAAALYSILATVAWPVVGVQRLYLSLSRRKVQSKMSAGTNELELLKGLLIEEPVEPAELFEISGHPNPWLATSCYARSRRSVIRSHIDRLDRLPNSVQGESDVGLVPEYSTAKTAATTSQLEFPNHAT